MLAVLALFSYDPHDPNIFSLTAGGEAGSPNNWIGGFGASLAAALYALLRPGGLGRSRGLLFVLGWSGSGRAPLANPGSKAAGRRRCSCSRVPMLLALAFGRRRLFGEEMEPGGIVGRALGRRVPRRGSARPERVLLASTLVLLARAAGDAGLARATSSSALRVRFAGLCSGG